LHKTIPSTRPSILNTFALLCIFFKKSFDNKKELRNKT
jgi:hypothetical protein